MTDVEAGVRLKKADIIRALENLPDEVDPEDVMYRVYVLEKIAQGEAAIQAGDVLTQEEVERITEEWLK